MQPLERRRVERRRAAGPAAERGVEVERAEARGPLESKGPAAPAQPRLRVLSLVEEVAVRDVRIPLQEEPLLEEEDAAAAARERVAERRSAARSPLSSP
jgi:hypothetical protein